jgi:acyl dehydratase
MAQPDSTIDYGKVVHGEQSVTLCAPLPHNGAVFARTRIAAIVDKGRDRGAVIHQERTIKDAAGRRLAVVMHASFCRADGGLTSSDPEPPGLPPVPGEPPDEICDLPTTPQSGLLYRLSGDRNPLHAEPAAAIRAGYPRPILHGLATYGVAGHAILRTCCGYEAEPLRSIACRFTAPVFPGETIRTEIWQRGTSVRFRATVPERDAVVLDRGVVDLHACGPV